MTDPDRPGDEQSAINKSMALPRQTVGPWGPERVPEADHSGWPEPSSAAPPLRESFSPRRIDG